MIIWVKDLTAVTELSNLSMKIFLMQIGMGVVKHEDKMLILDRITYHVRPMYLIF